MTAPRASHDRALQRELPWLQALARKLAREDGDDLAQDTWIRAREHAPVRGDRLRPWLARVLRNNQRMQRRSARARERREQNVPQREPAMTAESIVAANQLYALLDELLEELDDEDRALIEARFFEGRSSVEIATKHGLPAATVRTRLRRTLLRLRSQLDERCGGRKEWAALAVPSWMQLTGVMTMKVWGSALIAAAAAVALWMATSDARGRTEDTKPEVSAAVSEGVVSKSRIPAKDVVKTSAPAETPPARTAAERVKARRALHSKVRTALDEHTQQEQYDPTYELPALSMTVAVGRAVAPCKEMLAPDTAGRVSFAVHYIGAPDLGGVVDSVTLEGDTLQDEDFTQCLLAAAELAELKPPENFLEGDFKAHYTVGPKPNPLANFVESNPDIIEQYPVFAGATDPDADRAEVASGIAQAMESDTELAKRFEQWIIDSGSELSHIREE